ncbi:MAG: YgaP family membrane protein [Bacillota bacterium]
MQNVGKVDRFIRIVLGIIILSLLFFLKGDTKYFALIGVVPLFTGLANYCPLYKLLGIDTKKKR